MNLTPSEIRSLIRTLSELVNIHLFPAKLQADCKFRAAVALWDLKDSLALRLPIDPSIQPGELRTFLESKPSAQAIAHAKKLRIAALEKRRKKENSSFARKRLARSTRSKAVS